MAAAARYADGRAGTISFAVVDEAGRLHGLHRRAVAPSASVLKAMLLVAYLRRSDVRHRPLASWERDLLGPMIRRSDNAAATRMVALVGERRLTRLARAAGMEHFRLHLPVWGLSEITPRGQALFFDRIGAVLPPRHRHYALHLLASVIPSQRWGVGRVSHGRWRLYFKGGWGSGTGLVDHQVARYAADGERFALALFTRFNPDHEYGKETLRGLAKRLLSGVARPGPRLPHAARFVVDGRFSVAARGDCTKLAIRSQDGSRRGVATGASSCRGFRLASAGDRAMWAWSEAGTSRLATASFDDTTATDLGTFDSSDPLGAVAGRGRTLAYQHGSQVTVVDGPSCPAPAGAVLAVGGGLLATAAGGTIDLTDPAGCAAVRSFQTGAQVTALGLADDLVVALVRGDAGHVRLEGRRISSGALLWRRIVPRSTLPTLAVRGSWILFRTSHSLRVAAAGSGRAWHVWSPRRGPVGAGLAGRRIRWVENHEAAAHFWSLRLPRRQ